MCWIRQNIQKWRHVFSISNCEFYTTIFFNLRHLIRFNRYESYLYLLNFIKVCLFKVFVYIYSLYLYVKSIYYHLIIYKHHTSILKTQKKRYLLLLFGTRSSSRGSRQTSFSKVICSWFISKSYMINFHNRSVVILLTR